MGITLPSYIRGIMKRAIVALCLVPVFLLTACTTKVETAEEKAIKKFEAEQKKQSDKKIYGEPSHFTVDSKINLNEIKIPEEAYVGDSYIDEVINFFPEDLPEEDKYIDYSPAQDMKILATYDVEGDKFKKVSGKLNAEQLKKLEYTYGIFTRIIPKSERKNLIKLEVYEKDASAAYINNHEERTDKMVLGINIDEAKDSSIGPVQKYEIASLFIHEFGHLFSTDNIETKEGGSCYEPNGPTFDCYKPNSYINVFHNEFWSKVDKNYKQNGEKDNKDLRKFYDLNKDNFINSYAASNPYEDFAETFMTFVTEYVPEKSDDVVSQKIAFFYQYDNLVKLRTEILKNVLDLMRE